MRIVEKSPNRLVLSNADSFWSKWGFTTAIVALLLLGVFIAVKVIRPVCWSGALIGCFILFMIIRELPRTFDMEFWFNRESNQFKVIKRPWLGRPKIEQYPLPDITEVKVIKMKIHRNYPGQDYIEDENKSIESPVCEVELRMRSGSTVMIYGATHLAELISEFLELPIR